MRLPFRFGIGAAALLIDAALLFSLRHRPWAIGLLQRDSSGALFEAAPDSAMRIAIEGRTFDYRAPFDAIDPGPEAVIPVRPGGDRGLDDLRTAIRWGRDGRRVGEASLPPVWRLRDAVHLARTSTRRFYCGSYSRAMVAVLQGMGYPARVDLMDGHIVSEVYLPALGQWVVADALYDAIPVAPDGRPLSLVQLKRRLHGREAFRWGPVTGEKSDAAEMDPAARRQVEADLRGGMCFTCDGLSIFGPLGKPQRMGDLLAGRPRAIQLALFDERPLDRTERRIRLLLLGWNLAGAVALLALLTPGRSAVASPATVAPSTSTRP